MVCLERAGFLDRKDTEVRYLSHGEQRQLEIVLGLASDPKVLLLDEPAAGLSSGKSTEMAKFLMRLDPNLAILLIEHDMDVVFDVADQISVLHFGEVLETGTPEQIHGSKKVQEIYLGTGLIHGDSGSPGHSYLLRGRLCPPGTVLDTRAGADPGAARAQRRRQVDARELDRRFQSAAPRTGSSSRARTSPGFLRSKRCGAGWGSCRRGGASFRP